jgi:hypothetical protein
MIVEDVITTIYDAEAWNFGSAEDDAHFVQWIVEHLKISRIPRQNGSLNKNHNPMKPW